MVTSMRKIIWPRAPLSTATASPAGAEESEGERRHRGATDKAPDTSPLPSKPFLERGTRDTQRVSGVPTGDRPLRTRELVLGTRRSHSPHRERGTPALPLARSPAARRPGARRLSAAEGAQRSCEPKFFFFFCASCHARERRRAKPRGGKTPQRPRRGPAACARVRGGEGSPDDPALALPLPPAPAYLPGSPQRLAPPAPS